MNTRLITLLVLGMLAVSPPLLAAPDSHTHTLRFNADALRIGDTEAEGTTYTEITLKGLDNQGEAGDPSLPWSVYSVSVPPEAVDFRVSVNGSVPRIITLDHLPLPVQHDIPTSMEYTQPPFATLATKYTQGSTVYPENRAVVRGVSTIGGFNRVVTVAVTPFAWSSADNMLAMQEEVQVTLSWRTDSKVAETLLYPGFSEMVESAIEETKEMVVNPEAVGSYKATLSQLTSRQRVVTPAARIPYLIVTTKYLAPYLERLAALRRLRGIQSRIVCIEDILADTRFKDGDLISGINDDAGKLRAYLQYAYSDLGTNYVLLAGPYPKIPGRWAKYYSGGNLVYHISNHYFSNLTVNWNGTDDRYAVFDYQLSDYGTTIGVGRLNCSQPYEIKNYIDKLITYEYLPKGTDHSYLDQAFVLIGEDYYKDKECTDNPHGLTITYDNNIRNHYRNNFPAVVELYSDSCSMCTGAKVIEEMNKNQWGYVDLIGHGHVHGVMSCAYKHWFGVNASDDYEGGFQKEVSNGLDCWNNIGYPNWSISMSCSVGALGQDNGCLTFPDSYLVGGLYGGVAFLGNSGEGYMTPSAILTTKILSQVSTAYKTGRAIPYAGYVEKKGKDAYLPGGYSRLIARMYTMGDPLTMLWAKAPRKTSLSGNLLKIDGLTSNDAVKHACLDLNAGSVAEEWYGLDAPIIALPRRNQVNTYYRADMKPYIAPTELVDYRPEKSSYICLGETIIKGASDSSTSYGVFLYDGIQCTLESLSSLQISAPLKTLGSVLSLKSRDCMKFSDCKILTGSNIECDRDGTILLDSDVLIEKGAVFTIK